MSPLLPEAEAGSPERATHWAEVIYRELCAERLWTSHFDIPELDEAGPGEPTGEDRADHPAE